jgi:hypothetical protein
MSFSVKMLWVGGIWMQSWRKYAIPRTALLFPLPKNAAHFWADGAARITAEKEGRTGYSILPPPTIGKFPIDTTLVICCPCFERHSPKNKKKEEICVLRIMMEVACRLFVWTW